MKKMLAILMALGLVCSSSGLVLSAPAQQAAPATAAAPAPAAKPAPKAAPQKVEAGYRGNPESKIYHNSSCRYYKSKSASKSFASPADAKAPGTVPARSARAKTASSLIGERLLLLRYRRQGKPFFSVPCVVLTSAALWALGSL